MASKNRKANNQKDHETVKYISKARHGIPVFSWVKTVCTAGKFTQSWSRERPE